MAGENLVHIVRVVIFPVDLVVVRQLGPRLDRANRFYENPAATITDSQLGAHA